VFRVRLRQFSAYNSLRVQDDDVEVWFLTTNKFAFSSSIIFVVALPLIPPKSIWTLYWQTRTVTPSSARLMQ
jgi:hypothetical protein